MDNICLPPKMSSRDPRQWRMVALSSQVATGRPVGIVCGAADLVLFRDVQGVCRALADRCAHRRARLSDGRVTAQFLVECPYHGWRYDGSSGACVGIPNLRADEAIPKNYRVCAYQAVERDGFILVLLDGDEANAQPEHVELPKLDDAWEGEQLLGYPEEFFMDTLVDCPSSVLAVSGVQILDGHPFG